MPRARKAAGCKASLKSHPCRCHALSPLPMRPASRWKGGTRTAGQTAPGGLRVYLPTSLCSGDFTRMISEKQKTLTAFKLQGSQPITPEPAPSHRLWASAWARPLADAITLTCTRKQQPQKGTFLLCWRRGHFHFALTHFTLCWTKRQGWDIVMNQLLTIFGERLKSDLVDSL